MERARYPKYLYGPSDTFRIVASAEEQIQAEAAGFRVWQAPGPAPESVAETTALAPTRRGRPRKGVSQE